MNGAILDGVPPLRRPVVPYRGLRGDDKYGSGAFGASRDGGTRVHLGSDHVSQGGDTILAPATGEITLLGYAYPDTRAFRTIHIIGRPPHAGFRIRLLYVSPNPHIYVGRRMCAGEEIGVAQDIGQRYEGIICHIHMDLWIKEDKEWRRVDPELWLEKAAEV